MPARLGHRLYKIFVRLKDIYYSSIIINSLHYFLQNTPDDVYKLMLDCWDDDHIKRPTFAVIAQRVEELLNDNM